MFMSIRSIAPACHPPARRPSLPSRVSLLGKLALLATALIAGALSGTVWAQSLPDYENPRALSRGTEKPHATMTVYPDAASASAARRREESPFHRSLNGEWDYLWLPKPADVPACFWKP